MGLAFDPLSNCLAVCNYNAVVQVYTASPTPQKIWSSTVANFIPKSIQFGAMRGNAREVLVFGYHDGKM